MFFAGLPLSTLLAVFGAAAAVTVVLYILKLRRRPVAVPFSRMWESVLRDKEATSLFSQLKRLLSLLLQLALLALIVLALGDPRQTLVQTEGRNLVVLVDGSASMKATDVSPSRLGVAQSEVKRLIQGLGENDRLLIAQVDAALTPLSTMTGEVAELELAADALKATDTRADWERALSFAVDSLHGLSKPEVVVLSDGAWGDTEELAKRVDLKDITLTYLPVGKSAENVAITEFSVRRYPLDKARCEVMLEVVNLHEAPQTVELSLLGDGELIDVTRLSVAAGERLPRFYKDLGGASRTLEAKIRVLDQGLDHLPADNHAYALMPERKRARVLVVTPGNTYLEAALLLDEYLDVRVVEPDAYPPDEPYDVAIFDGVAPPIAEQISAALYLDPPEGGPVERGKRIEMFGFDSWDKKTPVLRWMVVEDIQVLHGHTFKPKPDQKVLGASQLGPLLVSGNERGKPFVALGFDPKNSDFVLRVAWPLFVLNTINAFVEEGAGYLSSYRTGEVWRVPAPSAAKTAELEDPLKTKRTVPVKEGRAVHLGEHAGFYSLEVPAEPEAYKLMFAANLSDIDESRIAPVRELAIGSQKASALQGFQPGVRREIWIYLLLLAVAVSAIEWFTYHRRLTV